MTKTNRDLMKRLADQALRDLQSALANLGNLRNIYAGGPTPDEGVEARPQGLIDPDPDRDHPEYRQAVESIAEIVIAAHDLLEAFRKEVM
jgi:hypothetical protein